MPAAPADIKVQRGSAVFGASEDFLVVSFPESILSTSRAFVRITNTISGTPADSVDNTEYDNRDITANVTSISTTTFRLDRFNTAVDFDVDVQWEVIEYIGESGGPNEFIVRGLVEELQADGTNSSSVDLSSLGISDSDDCVPFLAGYRNNSNLSQWSRVHTTATFSGANPDLDLVRSSTNGANRSSWFIVEFTGSNWTIEHNTAGWLFSSTQTVTLSASYDWDHTWVYSLFRPPQGENGLDEIGWLLFRQASDGDDEYTLFLEAGADDLASGDYVTEDYVISNDEMEIGRVNSIRTSDPFLTTDSSKVLSFTSPVGTADRLSVFVTATCSGAGTAYPRAHWNYTLTDDDEITLSRSYVGQPGEWARTIIKWPDFLGPFEIEAEADLPGLGSASGTLTQVFEIAGTADLPGLGSASGTLTQTFEVAGTATLPGLGAEAVLTQVFELAGTATLPGLGASGALTQVFAVTAVADLPGLGAAQGTLAQVFVLAAVADLPGLGAAQGALTQVFVVAAIAELPGLGAAGTATQIFILAGTATLPRIGAEGVLTAGVTPFVRGTCTRLDASYSVRTALAAGRAIVASLAGSYDQRTTLQASRSARTALSAGRKTRTALEAEREIC